MKFTSGLPETACGRGSTLAATEDIRRELPGILSDLGVTTFLDAPCGDANWISAVDFGNIAYVGVDNDPDHVGKAVKNFAATDRRRWAVDICDIINDELPACDAILCRDFLQHMPNAKVARVLENFEATGARWLLATSFDNAVNADIAAPGMFRPLSLQVRPFNLGAPLRQVADGEGRILGVWDMEAS